MKIEIERGYFSVEKCKQNPKKLYIFGDNWEGIGKGGQAIIRDEENAFGISTKYSCAESFSDTKFEINKSSIDMETDLLVDIADNYEAIVFPYSGLGTGLANLQSIAPRTLIYLSQVLLDKFQFNNLAGLKSN